MSESFLGTDYIDFDHVRYAREWTIDWDWYDEMVRDWDQSEASEEHKTDPVADLLGIWNDDEYI